MRACSLKRSARAPSSEPSDAACKMRRVSSDVRPRPGKNMLRLTFPHELRMLPIHSCSAVSHIPTDDDGDAAVARKPPPPRCAAHAPGADFELLVQCSRSSSVGDCGVQVWGASLLLAEYLWAVRHSLSGCSVLELGAGLAIPSICVSGFCREVFVSDCNIVRRMCPFTPVHPCDLRHTCCRLHSSAPTRHGHAAAAAAAAAAPTAPFFTSIGATPSRPHPSQHHPSPHPRPQPLAISLALTSSSRQTSHTNPLSRKRSSVRCARCCSQPPLTRALLWRWSGA